MNLYLFPEAACHTNGYGIGVEFAYKRLQPKEDDIVVWYTDLPRENMLYVREKNDFIVQKNKFFSIRSVINILLGKDRTQPHDCDLAFLANYDFDEIHLDESFFLGPIRKIFPNKQFSVRLHNCYSRIYDRQRMMGTMLDWKYMTKLKAMYKVEQEVFQDAMVHKIFISNEDRDYYQNIFGVYSDSETWAYIPDMKKAEQNRKPLIFDHRIVWFGGIESHKRAAIVWFINKVLPEIKREIPDVEFHLWGKGSEQFNAESNGIFGHGFFEGNGVPSATSLYVNPDIIGGGIKLKLQSLIESGIPFISSFFGYEGYSHDLIDNKYIIVEEEARWAEKIIHIIK